MFAWAKIISFLRFVLFRTQGHCRFSASKGRQYKSCRKQWWDGISLGCHEWYLKMFIKYDWEKQIDLVWLYSGDSELADLLLKNSAIREIKDTHGKTPLDIATEKGNFDRSYYFNEKKHIRFYSGFKNLVELFNRKQRAALEGNLIIAKSFQFYH